MKSALTCKDLGVDSCSFEARSDNKEEIKDAFFSHAQKYHPQLVKNMSDNAMKDMAKQMEMKMKSL